MGGLDLNNLWQFWAFLQNQTQLSLRTSVDLGVATEIAFLSRFCARPARLSLVTIQYLRGFWSGRLALYLLEICVRSIRS
jgi:hypothetical protein